MKRFSEIKKQLEEACWKGYKQVGGKMKNGKMVPNCVPVKEAAKAKGIKEENKDHTPVAPVPDRKYIKGTPEWKAHKEKSKPINGHPTNVKEEQIDEKAVELSKEEIILERGEDSKGYKRSTESGAGLTRKGAKHFGIKTAVTTPPSKLKKGSKAWNRRKSFCARMGGMKGPMKDSKGRPTRKAMSLRRWHCEE